jgi:hypothetical protein
MWEFPDKAGSIQGLIATQIFAAGLPQQLDPVNSSSNWNQQAPTARTTQKPSVQHDLPASAPGFVPQTQRNSFAIVNKPHNISHYQSEFPSQDAYDYRYERATAASTPKLRTPAYVCEQPRRTLNIALEQGKRTLAMTGLPNEITLLDLVNRIRGGQLLSIIIRSQRGSQRKIAHISFVEPTAAATFLGYFKQANILILGQRVSVHHADLARRLWFLLLILSRSTSSTTTVSMSVVNMLQDFQEWRHPQSGHSRCEKRHDKPVNP